MISGESITIIVRPNSKKTEFLGFDEQRLAYRVAIKAKPEKSKANAELVKFMKKYTGRDIELIKGKTSRTKTLRIH